MKQNHIAGVMHLSARVSLKPFLPTPSLSDFRAREKRARAKAQADEQGRVDECPECLCVVHAVVAVGAIFATFNSTPPTQMLPTEQTGSDRLVRA